MRIIKFCPQMEREAQVCSTTTLLSHCCWKPSGCLSLGLLVFIRHNAKTHFRMSLKPNSRVRNSLDSFFTLTNQYHKSVLQVAFLFINGNWEWRIFGARSFPCFSLGCQFLVEFLLVDLLWLAQKYICSIICMSTYCWVFSCGNSLTWGYPELSGH